MGLKYFVAPIYTSAWSEYIWENLREEEVKEFIKRKPMPKNTLYKNEEEFLKDVKHGHGIIIFPIEEFMKEENKEFFEWFAEVLRECYW